MDLGQKLLTILTAEKQILKLFGCASATYSKLTGIVKITWT